MEDGKKENRSLLEGRTEETKVPGGYPSDGFLKGPRRQREHQHRREQRKGVKEDEKPCLSILHHGFPTFKTQAERPFHSKQSFQVTMGPGRPVRSKNPSSLHNSPSATRRITLFLMTRAIDWPPRLNLIPWAPLGLS